MPVFSPCVICCHGFLVSPHLATIVYGNMVTCVLFPHYASVPSLVQFFICLLLCWFKYLVLSFTVLHVFFFKIQFQV